MRPNLILPAIFCVMPSMMFASVTIDAGLSGTNRKATGGEIGLKVAFTSNVNANFSLNLFKGSGTNETGKNIIGGMDFTLRNNADFSFSISGQPKFDDTSYAGIHFNFSKGFGDKWKFTPSVNIGGVNHDNFSQVSNKLSVKKDDIVFKEGDLTPGASLSYNDSSTLSFSFLLAGYSITGPNGGKLTLAQYEKQYLASTLVKQPTARMKAIVSAQGLMENAGALYSSSWMASFSQDLFSFINATFSYSRYTDLLPTLVSSGPPLKTIDIVSSILALDVAFTIGDHVTLDLTPSYTYNNNGLKTFSWSALVSLMF